MEQELVAGFEVGEIVFVRRQTDTDEHCLCEYNECGGDCDCDGDFGCCNQDVG